MQMSERGAMQTEVCSKQRFDRRNVLSDDDVFRETYSRTETLLESTVSLLCRLIDDVKSDEAISALSNVLQHIYDLMAVHKSLQIPESGGLIDATAYVRTICQAICRSRLQYLNIDCVFLEDAARLPAVYCWRMGLIVSELITAASNCLPTDGSSKIEIDLSHRGSFVTCSVAGCSKASIAVGAKRGSRIIEALTLELNGYLKHRHDAGMVVDTLSFPWSRLKTSYECHR